MITYLCPALTYSNLLAHTIFAQAILKDERFSKLIYVIELEIRPYLVWIMVSASIIC